MSTSSTAGVSGAKGTSSGLNKSSLNASSTSGASSTGLGSSTGSTKSSTSNPASSIAATLNSAPRSNYRFNGFNVPFILTWRDPQATGFALAEALILWVVLSSTLTLRLFLRLTFWTVGLLSGSEYVTRQLQGGRSGVVSSYRPSRFLPVSDQTINGLSHGVSQVISQALYGVQHVLDARSPTLGLQVAGLAWVFYVLLGWFSLRALALAAIVITFALPAAYLQFKTQIDSHLTHVGGHVHDHVNKAHSTVYAKAGPQIDFAKKLFGQNRGGFPANETPSQPVRDVPGPSARSFDSASGSASGFSSGYSQPSHLSQSSHTSGGAGASSHNSTSGFNSSSTSGSHNQTASAAGTNPYATGVNKGDSSFGSSSSSAPQGGVPLTNLPDTSRATHAAGHSTLDPAAGVPLTQSGVSVPADVFQQYDSVPSFVGTTKIPIDKETANKFSADADQLRSQIAKDKRN